MKPTSEISKITKIAAAVSMKPSFENNLSILCLKALGWDMDNEQGASEKYKEVVVEDRVLVKGKPKAPDYSFKIGENRKFFLEAKQPFVNIKSDYDPAFQLRRYAWSGKLPISILTDFEEFAVYDTTIEPKASDNATVARIEYFTYDQYSEVWEQIYDTFAKESINKGSFDKYVAKEKRGKQLMDKTFLKQIEEWREWLAKDIAKNNKRLSVYNLNFAVQKIIDRLIFLRIAEDRGIEDYENLKRIVEQKDSYSALKEYFKRSFEKFDSSLFDSNQDKITSDLKISDQVLDKILDNLYFPKSPFAFDVIGVEILGNIYEQFLGKIIRLTESHRAIIEEKPEVKKAGGVYYTPQYIVDYIVKNTVGELLRCHPEHSRRATPKEASKLRILDPACGSGSFLIGAYEYLLDWHQAYYSKLTEDQKKRLEKKGVLYKRFDEKGKASWYLSTKEKKQIMLNNIYGVDIDEQAVEVTKLSLALKMLEDENRETINQQMKFFPERLLPDLSNNIKCGNSLIGTDYWDNPSYNDGVNPVVAQGPVVANATEEEIKKVNAFDWEEEFPEILTTTKPNIYHVTFVTYQSRYSERMATYHVHTDKGIFLNPAQEKKLTEIIAQIVKEESIKVIDYNICGDHVHMLISCQKEELSEILRKIKGKSSRLFNKRVNPLVDREPARFADGSKMHLWAQKYYTKLITSDEQLQNTISYISSNREKHKLPPINRFDKIVNGMKTSIQDANKPVITGGFDTVIGNPPYIRVQTLEKDSVKYFNIKYRSAVSNYDIYILFLEIGLKILTKGGYLSMILPNKFISSKYGSGIRRLLTQNKLVKEILNFGDYQIFEQATTYTCILTLSNKQNVNFKYLRGDKYLKEGENKTVLEREVMDQYIINSSHITQNSWHLMDSQSNNLLLKLTANNMKLEDYTQRIFQGLKTGADKVFILEKIDKGKNLITLKSNADGNDYKLENEILFPLIKGTEMRNYRVLETNKYILFPYIDGKLISQATLSKEYPNVWKYLNNNRKVLAKREGGKFDGKNFYMYSRNQALEVIKKRKLITPDIAPSSRFCFDEEGQHLFTGGVSGGYGIIVDNINELVLLGILNSKLFNWYIINTSSMFRGGFYSFEARFIKSFPIPKAAAKTALEEQVGNLLTLKKNLVKAEGKKKEIMKKQCERLEREIDEEVYRLYGLNKKEIEIIEKETT